MPWRISHKLFKDVNHLNFVIIISSALEFIFSNYLDYKFNQIVKKLT